MNRRESLQLKVEKMRSVKAMMQTDGWKAFLQDIEAERRRHYKTLIERVDNLPYMAKAAGRVDTLDDVLTWTDRVIHDGNEAFQELAGRKKREEGDE